MKKYFFEKTGMYIDWPQIERLPDIDTFIDVGVGKEGTPELYNRFPKAKLILIDPIQEAENYAKENLFHRDFEFFRYGLGEEEETKLLYIEKEIGRSTLLNVTSLNYESEPVNKIKVEVRTLDSIFKKVLNYGKIGLKIDTEGYELKIIKGAKKVLKTTHLL